MTIVRNNDSNDRIENHNDNRSDREDEETVLNLFRRNRAGDQRISSGLFGNNNGDGDEEMQRPLVRNSGNYAGYSSFGDINRNQQGIPGDNNRNTNGNNNTDNNTTDGDDNTDARHGRAEDDEDLDTASIEETVLGLTDRLRCLFAVLTLPILPLGTALSLLLIFLMRAAFVQDLTKKCSQPMHSFAVLSLIFFVYTPNHKAIKQYLFQYSREQDGPVRPRSVRIYDQLYHTSCLLYVYFGYTLMNICRSDIDLGVSTCETTCPNLYSITQIFVSTLELFTLVLLLPLVCLPCIYLYIIRRATNASTMFHQTVQGNRNGNGDQQTQAETIKAWEIMEAMDTVKLVYKSKVDEKIQMINLKNLIEGIKISNDKLSTLVQDGTNNHGSDKDIENQQITQTLTNTIIEDEQPQKIYDLQDVRECCICMQDFYVYDDINALRDEIENEKKTNLNVTDPTTIVRTKCGHIFHVSCIGRWIEGSWSDSFANGLMQSRRRNRLAERKVCPLCRADLTPKREDDSTPTPDPPLNSDSVI